MMNKYNIKTLMLAISIIAIQILMYVYIIYTDISNDCARIFLGLFYVLFFVLPVFYIFVNLLESAKLGYNIKEAYIRLYDDIKYILESMDITYYLYKINSTVICFIFLVLLYIFISI